MEDDELSQHLCFVNACFYISWDRYSNKSRWSNSDGEYICVIDFSEDEGLREAVEGLEGCDSEMIDGCDYIDKKLDKNQCVVGAGILPSEALKDAEDKVKERFMLGDI